MKKLKKSRLYKMIPIQYRLIITLGIVFFFFIIGLVVLLFLLLMGSFLEDNPAIQKYFEGQMEEEQEQEEREPVSGAYIVSGIAPEVTRYEDIFRKYAKENGIEEHTEVIMAMTMQESGGRLADVMQSSESLGLPVNTLTDPEKSIEQGVKYFAQTLDEAGGDLELALQAYNMGNGFIGYAKKHNDGKYSKELAIQFSNEMASKMGWSRYGDVNYVDNVMRYVEEDDSVPVDSSGDWALPLKIDIRITSEFGVRTHPVTGEAESFHGGTDFACTPEDNIYSVKDGEVVEAIHSNVGYGNYITVQHGKNEFSRYGHMTSLSVSVGDSVNQGDSLGKCGTTGTSTGNHLHLEHMTELGQAHEDKKDPRKTLGL
ncbi:lysozyme family protein [Oceanobacillus sp. FSL W8-0428]|uniref:lysozyme family protein n=1 Tax=Oceanobacillus sp. FSL W8-0428 TaxID=2921715 RepID=UPI0030F8423D